VSKSQKSVVISDLDNTLFDWVDIWYTGFRALLNALIRETGDDEEILIPQIKEIHEKRRTSEYAFLIDELPAMRERFTSAQDFQKAASRIREEFEQGRSSSMHLYPTVDDTLKFLKSQGCLVVGYTESMGFYSNYRLRKLQLDDTLDFIYSPPDHDLPDAPSVPLELYTNHERRLRKTRLRNTPQGEIKPNPAILLQIVTELGAQPTDCVYVGDSLMKDVVMAQQADITDVWAKYGEARHRQEYELLRKVTHWTIEAVEKERVLSARDVKPCYTLGHSFGELKEMFTFKRFPQGGIIEPTA
jgi:phosphoglycolate phosphatase